VSVILHKLRVRDRAGRAAAARTAFRPTERKAFTRLQRKTGPRLIDPAPPPGPSSRDPVFQEPPLEISRMGIASQWLVRHPRRTPGRPALRPAGRPHHRQTPVKGRARF
jgi:hypothetical protein